MTAFLRRSMTLGILLSVVTPCFAGLTLDPKGDYLSTFTGPKNGDLDVLGVEVTFDGTRFTFTGVMDGAIGTTAGGSYVWGVNRGAGTARFAGIGLTNVLFDSVVILRPGGTSTVNRIVGGGSTTLGAADVMFSGNTITAVVQASFLPTQGFSLDQYTFNLWPRALVNGANQISDFAPDNSNILATSVPEPSTLISGSFAVLTGLGFALRRNRKSFGM